MSVSRLPPKRHGDQDVLADAVFAAFQAQLCQENVWDSLATLSDKTAAPDPHGFGYAQPWGQGLGLHPSRQIPAAHLLAVWSTPTGWAHWLAPDVGVARSAHGVLRAQTQAWVRERMIADLQSALPTLDGTGVHMAAVLNTSGHTLKIHCSFAHHDGMVVFQRPSGNRSSLGPWPQPSCAFATPPHMVGV